MAKVESNELLEPITAVLRSAASGTIDGRGFLTSYQILKRLDQTLQDRLQTAYGDAGGKGGNHYGPATRVAKAADGIRGIEKHYLDTEGLQFSVRREEGDDDVEATAGLCALFRLS